MIGMALIVSCALKTTPISESPIPAINILITENDWTEAGLQVTVDIQTTVDAHAFDRALIETNGQTYPVGFAQPIEGLGYRLSFHLPIEHEAGHYVHGQFWLKGVEQAYSFALVTPFYESDPHDSH